MSNIGTFLLSFAFNLLVALIVVRFIYYPSTHNKAYVFTFLAFNTIIFFVLSFLASIEIGLGVGFGLFAIFSILRYRTDPIPIREMTYLFIIAALPVMNSSAVYATDYWPHLIAANLSILAIMLVLEKGWGFRYETSKQIVYEKIELIRPDRQVELQADLEKRTGLKIKRIVVGKVDFLRDIANIKVYYEDPSQANWLHSPDPTPVILAKDETGE
jgi:hypothetical protein